MFLGPGRKGSNAHPSLRWLGQAAASAAPHIHAYCHRLRWLPNSGLICATFSNAPDCGALQVRRRQIAIEQEGPRQFLVNLLHVLKVTYRNVTDDPA